MSCGAPLPAISQPIPAQPVQNYAGMPPPQPNAQKTWWTIGIVGCFLLGAFGFGYGELLRQRAAAAKPDLLRVEAKPPSPDLLRLEPKPQELTRREGSPAPENTEMPADIKAWLEHLEETERRRVQAVSSMVISAMIDAAGMEAGGNLRTALGWAQSLDSGDSPAPTEQPAEQNEIKKQDLSALSEFFESLPPPDLCRPIYESYREALSETPGMIADINKALESVKDNPSTETINNAIAEVEKVRRNHHKIDKAGERTDRLVQEICDQFKTRKWFSVSGDIGGGGGMMGGMGGF